MQGAPHPLNKEVLMSRDISEKVKEVIAASEEIQKQHAFVMMEGGKLLRMINEELHKKSDSCDVYVLSFAADYLSKAISTKQ